MDPANVKKVTVTLRADLLERAQAATGRNITDTLTLGLEELERRALQRELASLQGKIEFDLDLEYTRQ